MSDDLFEQHRHIHAAARDLAAVLDRRPRINLDELNRYRVRLGSLILRHKQAEEEQIFAPLFRERWIDHLPHLKPYLDDIREQKSGYSQSVQKWTPQAIDADWTGYVATIRGRLKTLDETFHIEEEHIYRPVQRYRAERQPNFAAAAI